MATYGKKGKTPDPQAIIRRCKELKNKRENWDNIWDEVAHFVLPTKADFISQREGGAKRDQELYDSTAITSNQTLASGLHGALTAPSGRWFHIRFRDEVLNNDDAAIEWLEDSVDRIYKAIDESNFNSEVNELYLDLCCFGTAALLVETDKVDNQDSLNFRTVHLSEIAVAENVDGHVDTIYRSLKFSARQAKQLFPNEDLGESIERALQDKPDKEFEFIHAVYPREGVEPMELAPGKERPWASCWVQVKDKKLVREDGYYECPWMVPRWSKLSGDVYGFSPAMMARADIRTLNAAKLFELRAWEKTIDPPTLASYNGIIGDLRLDPGGLTYVRDINGIKPMQNGTQWQVSQIKSSELIVNIRRAFFNDQLQLHEGPNMTATEVRARMELMQQILGPVVGRLQSEFLNPLLQRVFMVMFRAGLFKEPPQSLMEGGSKLDVEYVSPLARAQKMEEVFAVERWFGQLGQMAQVDPTVLDIVDFSKIGRMLAKRLGVPGEVMKSEEDMARLNFMREQQAAAEQQMMAQQTALEQAGQAAQVAGAIDEAGQDSVGGVIAGMQPQ
tara:strand:+ start:2103 stop:3782 length:1680 start_codon:yes stop_codon:yes gene_type:complete